MKKSNKKGFTIVELVIVIAVIAILSAVLIPTFSNVTKNAKNSAAQQEASHALSTVLMKEEGALDTNYTYYFVVDNGAYVFKYVSGELKADTTYTATLADLVYSKTAIQIAGADTTTDESDDKYSTPLEDLSTKVKVYKVAA